jgi:hypothetical protein
MKIEDSLLFNHYAFWSPFLTGIFLQNRATYKHLLAGLDELLLGLLLQAVEDRGSTAQITFQPKNYFVKQFNNLTRIAIVVHA